MLNVCFITVISVLCVIGIYSTIKEIVSVFTKSNTHSTIILEVYNDVNKAEQYVRSALSANPESEIYILDKSHNSEIRKILNILYQENNRIHIETAPEK